MRLFVKVVMRMPSCFFIGHREASALILPYIKRAIEELIRQEKVRDFYVGGYGNFDRLSGEAVLQLKKQFPAIRLYRVLPYHPANRRIEIPNGFDGTFYPDGMEYVPRRYTISRANRTMIDQSAFLIAYVWHPASNAGKLLDYARIREKKGLIRIINLGEMEGAPK